MNKNDLINIFQNNTEYKTLNLSNIDKTKPMYMVLFLQDYEIRNMKKKDMINLKLFKKFKEKQPAIVTDKLYKYLFEENNNLSKKIAKIVKDKYKITEDSNRKLYFEYFDKELEIIKEKQLIKITKDTTHEYAGYQLEDEGILSELEDYEVRNKVIKKYLKNEANLNKILNLITKEKPIVYYKRNYENDFKEKLSPFLEITPWILLTFQIENDSSLIINKLSHYTILKSEKQYSIELLEQITKNQVNFLIINIDKNGIISEFESNQAILPNHYKFESIKLNNIKFIDKIEDMAWDIFLKEGKV